MSISNQVDTGLTLILFSWDCRWSLFEQILDRDEWMEDRVVDD
jgi:hypothetical protein